MTKSFVDNYDAFKNILQSGDCILFRSRGPASWMIRAWTKENFNHAAIIVRPHESGPFKGRRFILEAVAGGVTLHFLSEVLKKLKGEAWLYLLKDQYTEQRSMVTEWAINQVGTPYDYTSLFQQIFGRVSANALKLFCSEFCYMAWQAAGILVVVEHAPWPGEISRLKIFKSSKLLYRR